MVGQKENPTCERCGKVPTNVYNPNTPGHPTKRIDLCDECATKDDKATLVAGLNVAAKEPENVPDIAPAVGEPIPEPQTIEHGPKLQELNVAPPEPKAPVENLGPVPHETLKQKLAAQEKDHDVLVGKRQELQGQLTQISNLIMAKRGAIAQLRDLLGNAS